MSGISDLLGRNGILEQLLLWSVVSQVVQSAAQPALTALQQDVAHAHPTSALDPVTMADAQARGMASAGDAENEAARSGMDASRYGLLADLHKIRLAPSDLATAVLRSYMSPGDAQSEATPQGVTPAMFRILTDLAGDGISPQDAARALLRKLIPESGKGAGATSYEQAIAESRLHDKWGPVLAELSKVILSPPDAASAVVRNFMPFEEGAAKAQEQGVDRATFQTMVELSGDAPAPGQLAEALRRGLISDAGTGADSTSFAQGIAEGRLADKWADVVKGLAQLWPTPTDALDALVKGQLTEQEASALYVKLGGDPQFFTWLFNTIGEGPTPLEAAVMAARGIIPWDGTGPEVTSYEQAVKESHYRNKWTDSYRKLSEYHFTASEIVTFYAHGSLTHEQAAQKLAQLDMSPDDVAAYLDEAQSIALSDYRGLTASSVLDMYYGQLISQDLASQILQTLHVTSQAAGLLIAYVDMRRAIDQVTKSVSRLGTLYVNHKITTDTATQSLAQLGVPSQSIQPIITDWQITAAANVKTLTETQIVDAWYYQSLTYDEALSELTAIGYTQYDAWVLLSNKAKGPLPGKPLNTAQPPPGAVIPGLT